MIQILLIFIFVYLVVIIFFNLKFPEIRWNWEDININNIKFPPQFIWGTATASHQVEGNCLNNWSEFEKGFKSDGSPNIINHQISGLACDHWNRYSEDIDLINELGVSFYRFSIEWSKIQPDQNTFNQESLDHYSKFIDTLLEKNIQPVITLHHFTHPIWFDQLGAFEKEENIRIFVKFCIKVFNEYSNRVTYWCTINEPAVVATQGYFSGMFPPGKQNPQLAAIVLKNLLLAHVDSYRALKSLDNGPKAKIGLVKNINQFEPWRRWYILDWAVSRVVDYFFNGAALKFLNTGQFNIRVPGLAWIKYKNKYAIDSMDFFGLNYYSHNHLKIKLSLNEPFILKYKKNDTMTDMPYTIYAEGIYRAIKLVSKLNKPIIITENGIADKYDNKRSLFIQRYLYAVHKAINDGFNVKGYFYWSLMDNFEWAFGYDMKFGLFSVNFKTQERNLRNGSGAFIDIVKNEK